MDVHSPTAFISYAQESENHKAWVREFAARLRQSGIDASIDQWSLHLGDELPEFMERSIRENDYVLIVCTPTYKIKSNNRQGGVGYEGDIITGELFSQRNQRKFIPVLQQGSWAQSCPTWLAGKLGVDLSRDDAFEAQYQNLVTTILNRGLSAPPIVMGSSPMSSKEPLPVKKFVDPAVDIVGENYKDIYIEGILVDEVTLPKLDGSRGCALYQIPFKLSRRPSDWWEKAFVVCWDRPASFTTMHRPGIARIYGNRIILDGTTIQEVEETHQETLKWAVKQANELEKGFLQHQALQKKREEELRANHEKTVRDLAAKISFNE